MHLLPRLERLPHLNAVETQLERFLIDFIVVYLVWFYVGAIFENMAKILIFNSSSLGPFIIRVKTGTLQVTERRPVLDGSTSAHLVIFFVLGLKLSFLVLFVQYETVSVQDALVNPIIIVFVVVLVAHVDILRHYILFLLVAFLVHQGRDRGVLHLQKVASGFFAASVRHRFLLGGVAGGVGWALLLLFQYGRIQAQVLIPIARSLRLSRVSMRLPFLFLKLLAATGADRFNGCACCNWRADAGLGVVDRNVNILRQMISLHLALIMDVKWDRLRLDAVAVKV